MRRSGIFTGTFFVVIGSLFLMRQFDVELPDMNGIIQWWPLLLILFGISLMKLHESVKMILSFLSAGLFALILYSVITRDWIDEIFCDTDIECSISEIEAENDSHTEGLYEYKNSKTFSDEYEIAKLNIEAGAGAFFVGAVSDKNLIEAASKKDNTELSIDEVDSLVHINLEMSLNNHSKFRKNGSRVYMNTKPLWDIDIETGAAKMICDFSKFKVRTVDIEAGAAGIEIKLGELYDTVHVDIEVGVAKVKLLIPSSMSCIVNSDATALTSFVLDGFKKSEDTYSMNKSDSSNKMIYIDFDGAVAKLEIKNY